MVRRFNFRLERLLTYRKSLTESEKIELAHRVGELTSAEQNATQLRGYRNELAINQTRSLQEGTTAHESVNLNRHRLRIEDAINEADGEVAKASVNVEKQRVVLVERSRDQKAIELYKSRRWKLWLKEFYRDENRVLDDIASVRHSRLNEK